MDGQFKRKEDTDLIKAGTVMALAGADQMRTADMGDMTQEDAVENKPLPPWPDMFSFRIDWDAFELMDDAWHLPVCIAPFWPVGNKDCPIYRMTTLRDAVRYMTPVETTLDNRNSAFEGSQEQRRFAIERAYERIGLLPQETYKFWYQEAEKQKLHYLDIQHQDYSHFKQASDEVMSHPIAQRLYERMVAALASVPYLSDNTVPEGVWSELDHFCNLVDVGEVAKMLRLMPLPTSAMIWDTITQHIEQCAMSKKEG